MSAGDMERQFDEELKHIEEYFPTIKKDKKSYDIIVRFPTKKMADEWCGQMSDGFGEGFCDFSFWEKTIGAGGKEKYNKITASAPEGTKVFFVNSIEEF